MLINKRLNWNIVFYAICMLNYYTYFIQFITFYLHLFFQRNPIFFSLF